MASERRLRAQSDDGNEVQADPDIAWFEEHVEELACHAGNWVAIKKSSIVHIASMPSALVDWLSENHVADALIVKVPEHRDNAYLIA